MTVSALVLLAALLVVAGLVGFSAGAARGIERIVPPQGGFLDLDGERLHVLDTGSGRPVVLIHGLGGQMGNFTHSLVGRLSADFRVVAFDRPGSGYSPLAPGAPGDLAAQAATFARAIRALKLEKPVVVGHSYGGTVALALAVDHPDCVGALALVAPATQPIAAPPRAFRALAIRSRLLRRLFAWTVATPGGLLASRLTLRALFGPEDDPADFPVAGGGLLALRPANVYAASTELIAALALGDHPANITTRYPSLRIPVGILYGRGDRVLDWRDQGEAMKRTIASLDLEIVDGGHMLPVTQPDVVAAFIRRIAAKTSAEESVGRDPMLL
jgi:pimeloyl-ACP methyl ester carboxylesterase